MKLAEVHTIYETNASDIAAMLRTAASNIEGEPSEEDVSPTRAMVAVQIANNGQVQIYGWGNTDSLDSIGILNLGLAKLIATMISED